MELYPESQMPNQSCNVFYSLCQEADDVYT